MLLQSIKRYLSQLFSNKATTPLSADDWSSFHKELTYHNQHRFRLLAGFVIGIFLLLLGVDARYYLLGLWGSVPAHGYRVLLYLHCFISLFMMLNVGLALLIRPKNQRAINWRHRWHTRFFLFIGLWTLSAISYADLLISGSIAAWLGALFAFAAIFFLKLGESIALFGSSLALVVALIQLAAYYTGRSFHIQLINVVNFGLIAFIMSRIIYRYQLKDFSNRNLIRAQSARLEQLALHDHLTGLPNRRYMLKSLNTEMERARRYQQNFAIALMDIDHFKQVNDVYGHSQGDQVLMKMADIISRNIRTSDMAARWGGEEFLFLAPHASLSEMRQFMEKIRQLIANQDFGRVPTVTASFGIAQYQSQLNLESLIQEADKALYKAKQSGRNQVQAADGSPTERDSQPT
ncbi:MAG: GGDEF domain-containing protein [Leptospiraceae bacterium]|nr:GGDEF domain-containing protein [Leptospiraceae bacterium]